MSTPVAPIGCAVCGGSKKTAPKHAEDVQHVDCERCQMRTSSCHKCGMSKPSHEMYHYTGNNERTGQFMRRSMCNDCVRK